MSLVNTNRKYLQLTNKLLLHGYKAKDRIADLQIQNYRHKKVG
jgi:hypothetical protein